MIKTIFSLLINLGGRDIISYVINTQYMNTMEFFSIIYYLFVDIVLFEFESMEDIE